MLEIFRHKRILIVSPEAWTHHFVSKHQFAVLLASLGNNVFFLDPPGQTASCEPTKYEGLFVLSYKPGLRGLNRLPVFAARWLWKRDIAGLKHLAGGGFDIIWSFDPYRFQDLRMFGAQATLYYAADWHAGRKLERLICGTAGIVLSPSTLILDAIDTRRPKMKVSHGVAQYFFEQTQPMTLPGRADKVKVGYVGNLRIRSIDKQLVLATVQQHPEVDFIFAGDATAVKGDDVWDNVFALPNAYCTGPLDNRQVPAFLAACDVLTIFYNTALFRREASNSHKILEYLSSGKPVVSTPVAEYENMPELLCIPNTYSDFAALFARVLTNLPEYSTAAQQQQRILYAAARRYESVLSEIDANLVRLQSGKS